MRITKFILQFEQQILAAILLLLHLLTWEIVNPLLQFSLMFVLYGLFLMWQPLWKKEADINQASFLPPIIVLLGFSFFYLNESLIFFSLLISGLIGSRLFSYNTSRAFDLLAITILILGMAIGMIPLTFDQIDLPRQFAAQIENILLILILLFFFAPIPDRSQQTRSQIDLMHGILSAILISIVLLSNIVINILYGVDYIEGLLLSVFIVSTLTFGISWFWNPGVGYSGLGVLWNRYAMTIGGPFETWINTLTTLIEEPYISSSEFMQSACDHLVENDWLNGIEWQLASIAIQSGDKKGIVFKHPLSRQVYVTIYFKSDPGQALTQHTILLIRMAYQLYLSKTNQEKIAAEAHFETIHHTGARLTHDIKNILQSIKASLDIVQLEPKQDQQIPVKLLQQNLTQISERLESTLNKLKAPELSMSTHYVEVSKWLDKFKSTNQLTRLKFKSDIELDHQIPPDLFDSVINNLIANANAKNEASEILVDISANQQMIVVTVCDDGNPLDEEVENQLFSKPVSSGQGMGIGLYQSAIMARTFNYELELTSNQPGKICFSLYQHLIE